jgi:exopolysaccharide biosynthesis WecB/TagA/CpsF family protein
MRILVVQLGDIGDLVVSTPALSALREAYPVAFIAVMTNAHAVPVLEGTGVVDEVIPFVRMEYNNTRSMLLPENREMLFGLRRRHFDVIVFLHHLTLKWGALKFAAIAYLTRAKRRVGLDNGRGWFLTDTITDYGFGEKHQAQYWLDVVGLLGANRMPRPGVVAVQHYELPRAGLRVVIHAGSGGFSVARRWAPERFARVADRIAQRLNAQIVLVGSDSDNGAEVAAAMKSPVINLIGKTTIPELASVIQQSALFVGADSGVMHIAAAVGTPVVAIFGPTNEYAWGPWLPAGQSAVVRTAPVCAPCAYVQHEVGLRDGCEPRTCMTMVSERQVLLAVAALLKGERPPLPPPHYAPEHSLRRLRILGLPVDALTFDDLLETISGWMRDPGAHQVCTTNPEFMMMAQQDYNFRIVLQRADLCVPDGVGLLLAARLLRDRLPERVTGSDGVPLIAERAAREGWRLYLLGAADGVAEKAAAVLTERYPGLQIAGTYAGSPAGSEEDAIVERINASGADILFVAYGAPKQDLWIARNLPRLNVKMAMGVGGSFDFVAGIVPRAPQWMRRAGLEWLYRLYLKPSRIGRMTRLPRFLWAVLRRGHNGTWYTPKKSIELA